MGRYHIGQRAAEFEKKTDMITPSTDKVILNDVGRIGRCVTITKLVLGSNIPDIWTSYRLLELANISDMSLSSITYSIYQMWH